MVRVDLGVIAKKGYSLFAKAPILLENKSSNIVFVFVLFFVFVFLFVLFF